MLSMTGFGSAQVHSRLGTVTVRVRTLNGKSLRVVWRLHDILRPFLVEAETLLRSHINRGSVEVDGEVEVSPLEFWEVNEEILAHYAEIASRYGAVDGASLLALPGVVRQKGEYGGGFRKPFLDALKEALREVKRKRREEAKSLRKVINSLLRQVESLHRKIERNYLNSVPQLAEALASRVREVMGHLGVSVEAGDVLREAAIIAERSDIREELDRLSIHIKEFRRILREKGSIGLRLDFLAQEMQRESATLAAKCAEVGLATDIVELRATVAAIRQQLQNIE